MIEIVTLMFGGIIGLYVGAELLIFGGASLAYRLGLPVVVIGLVVVGYGTGTPELVVTLQASLEGRGDIAIGNIIGSNIANIGLILGVAAMIQPAKANLRLLQYDAPIMVVVSLLFSLLIIVNGSMGYSKGVILIAGLLIYTIWAIRLGKTVSKEEIEASRTRSALFDALLILSGFVILFIGGRLFLSGSVTLAKMYGVSDAVIGLTLIAFGTSLPELATCLVAGARNHGEIVLGNIIGSCIFNILAIAGLAALLNPITLHGIQPIDYGVMCGYAIALTLLIRKNDVFTRGQGFIFFVLYVGYIAIKYLY